MSRFSPLLAVMGLLVLASCDTMESPLLEPDATTQLIQDGRNTGSGVFLRPPISDNNYTRTGPFDITADPRVEICRLAIDGELTEDKVEAAACENGDSEPPAYWFETDTSYDGTTLVTVSPEPGGAPTADSAFSVGWKTDAADANKAFRATILVPGLTLDGQDISVEYQEAARFEAVLYDNSSTKLDAERVVGFTAGKNFPISFIVQQSAGCDGLDCFAYQVSCQADIYQTQHAGVFMPEDWAAECQELVPGPERYWYLFQERLENEFCVPTDAVNGIAFEPCYVWQLVEEVDTEDFARTFQPYTGEFDEPVIVQFCNDLVPEEFRELAGIFRYSVPPGEVALVPESSVPALTQYSCPFQPSTAGLLGFDGFTGNGLHSVLQLLGLEPRPLYAEDLGALSGRTIRMSHFQRFMELETLIESLPAAVVLGGSGELTVQLVSPPHHDDGETVGVAGLEVQYEIIGAEGDFASLSGDGASSCGDGCIRIETDADGFSTAILALDLEGYSGTVTIHVTVPADPDFTPFVVSVEAVDLLLSFLEPLDTGDFPGDPEPGFAPTVLICAEGLEPCTASTAEAVIPTSEIKLVEENGRKFYQADWKPRDTGTEIGGTYLAQILTEGITVGYSIPIVVTKGGKGERIDDVYYNGINSSAPLKFTIARVGQ